MNEPCLDSAPAMDWPKISQLCSVIVRGRLVGFTETGWPQVVLREEDSPLPARSVASLVLGDVGRDVLVTFEDRDVTSLIILGLIQPPLAAPRGEVVLDGERIVLTARRELVLKCGSATITLTRAGKVLIKGEYVLTRADGVNRIKGGSVQIN